MITLSVIKADTGGFVGHSAVHPDLERRIADRWEPLPTREPVTA